MVTTVAALVAAYNRREKTIAGLRGLYAAASAAGVELRVYLVDDGSTDGTSAAVCSTFPDVRLIRNAGGLYWCRAMHLAWQAAQKERADVYLWFNDDVQLVPDALCRLAELAQQRAHAGHAAIIVGTCIDAEGKQATYGGQVRVSGWRLTKTVLLPVADHPRQCDTMNGNVVWIPAAVSDRIGIIESSFAHAMGDIDYGFRARAAGIEVWVAPGFVGTCARNPVRGTFDDADASLAARWRHLMSPKGLPLGSWLKLSSRHGGLLWPLIFVWPYARVVLSSLRNARKRRAPLTSAAPEERGND